MQFQNINWQRRTWKGWRDALKRLANIRNLCASAIGWEERNKYLFMRFLPLAWEEKCAGLIGPVPGSGIAVLPAPPAGRGLILPVYEPLADGRAPVRLGLHRQPRARCHRSGS